MTCFDAIIAVLLSLPVWYQDSDLTRDERAAVYAPTVETICTVGQNQNEQAWLTAQAYAETRLSRYVLEERCEDGPAGARCDAGRAIGPWQQHRHCTGAWLAATREWRLEAAAECAIQTARHGLTVCGIGGAFGFQSGRHVCAASWVTPRVRLYRVILARLQEATHEALPKH